MDDWRRRGIIAGVLAAALTLVAGFIVVGALTGNGGGSPVAASTGPSPSGSGAQLSSGPPATKAATPSAYLAWVPVGLPSGFSAAAARLPQIARTTTVGADNVWLTRSADSAGTVVDDPSPNMIPIDAAGIDPRRFASFLPSPYRQIVAGLGPDQAILSRTSAKLRRLGPGGTLTFQGGVTVKVAAVLPDVLVGAEEVVVDTATGASIGITHDRYLLLRAGPGEPPTDAKLAGELARLLPAALRSGGVQVRAPGETTYLRMADLVLPPALIKARFGEWSGRPDPPHPGFLLIDPTWVAQHIVTVHLPVLGTVTCNKGIIGPLRRAMQTLVNAHAETAVHTYEGCYVPKYLLNDPNASISHHAWGVAVDINAVQSPYGAPPVQDPRLVKAMEDQGFIWGGRFIIPDGHHFEFWRRPGAPPPTVTSGNDLPPA